MPFKYILKWYQGEKEHVTIEAWHRYPTLKSEKEKAAFTIGKLEGNKVLLIRDRVYEITNKYGSKRYDKTLKVSFPLDDTKAIAEAYRIGLTASILSIAGDNSSIQTATNYVLNTTDEEIWFWTSKLLDSSVGPQKTISALCLISGTWDVPKKGQKIKIKNFPHEQVKLNEF